jgi:DNA-binding transcriptional ArsR family regulator
LAAPLAITLAAVVQHLHILEQGGLVHTEKAGRVRTCRIEPSSLSVAEQWFADRRSEWERRLDRLAEFLAEEEKNEPRCRFPPMPFDKRVYAEFSIGH